jgi:hypothetical protein
MRRLLIAALAVGVLSLTTAAQGGSGLKLRGTVTDKDSGSGLVTVVSTRLEHVLDVPGSLAAISVGQRVTLRGTTLRQHGKRSRVLARDVLIVSARILDRDEEPDDDEREVRGRITSLSPLTVAGLTCAVPSGLSLAGFRVGDVVEMTCDLIGGTWTLRKIHLEDDDEVRGEDDDRRGERGDRDDRGDGDGRGHRGGGDDDDDDNSGHGGGGDDSESGGSGRG